MSARLAGPVAVAVLALLVLLTASGLVLSLAFPDAEVANRLGLPFGFLVPIVYSVIGALIVVRQSQNTVGWLLLLLGFVGATLVLTEIYEPIVRDLATLVGPDLRQRLSDLTWVAFFPLLCLILQLFPAGRSLSPRWRYLAWSTWLWILVGAVLVLLSTDQSSPVPLLFLAWWLALIVMSVISVLARAHQASGAERQQIKWLAFGAIPGLIVIPSAATEFPEVFPLQMIGFMWVPLTIGIAVLRYRLYDIDRLVSRSIGYLILTATLVAVFALLVVGLLAALGPYTGGDSVPVAASTLVVFALFQPLRRRIQSAIDRRFDRARYDSALTVAAFGTRLRDEVDLDSVLVDLRDVIRATIGPSSASVWLRPTQGGVGR